MNHFYQKSFVLEHQRMFLKGAISMPFSKKIELTIKPIIDSQQYRAVKRLRVEAIKTH